MKSIFKFILIVFFILGSIKNSFAQFSGPCTDPLRTPQPTYSCPSEYKPVCGCDGKTYRNECSAYYRAGLNNYLEGSCASFDFDIAPNFTNYELQLRIYRKTSGYVVITIYNVHGYREKEINIYVPGANSTGGYSYLFPIDVYDLQSSVYLISIISDEEQQVKKFMKYNSF